MRRRPSSDVEGRTIPHPLFSVRLGVLWYYINVGMVLQQLELLAKETQVENVTERIGQAIFFTYITGVSGLASCLAIAQVIA